MRHLVCALLLGALTIFSTPVSAAEVSREEFEQCLEPYLVKGEDYDYKARQIDDFVMIFPETMSGYCRGAILVMANLQNHPNWFQRKLAEKVYAAIERDGLPAPANQFAGGSYSHQSVLVSQQGRKWQIVTDVDYDAERGDLMVTYVANTGELESCGPFMGEVYPKDVCRLKGLPATLADLQPTS